MLNLPNKRMDRDQGFNFKLLVPPRMNIGQVSAVRPQEIVENCGDFMNTLQQGYSKCFDKEQSKSFPTTSMFTPTKPARQEFLKVKAVPPMEKAESNCNPGQLYSKLFDEVEKIKCWKVKLDRETVQKERRLQDNKRTIETQRKAIQELQFVNENLSLKLEEQINENEDLRNKNNATRNLCNILKDTFERSAEKMHLFESEREETHHLFMENNESIQKLIAAYENLRIQAEADQQEMRKVKEDLQQFEDLKKKYRQEYNMKENEVSVLETKVKDKENELQKILLDLDESQKHCKQLQEATKEQCKLLKSSKTAEESLLQELHITKQHYKETEKKCEALAAMLEQSKEEYAQMIKSKDLSLEELSRVKIQQAEKLEQIQTTVHELQKSLSLEMQRAEELEGKLMANSKDLERQNSLLGETMKQNAKKDGQIKILQDELDKKSKSIESIKSKFDVTEVRVEELTAELSRKTKEAQNLKSEAEVAIAENDELKKVCKAAEKAQEDFNEKSKSAQFKVQELERQLITEKKRNEENTIQMEQFRKDIMHHEEQYKELLSNFGELQSEKTAIQQQFESCSMKGKASEANMKVSEEKVAKLTTVIQRLEEENQRLREEANSNKTKIQGDCQETETLQEKIEKNCEHLQEKITDKEKQINALETKLCNLRNKFDIKLKAQEGYQKENKVLKKQMTKEIAKSRQLENEINGLREESQKVKKLHEEDCQKFLKELESKSTFAENLQDEVQKLRVAAEEAVKNKDDAELRCQHKIADMVALMEKHKSQYDRMVEQKDAHRKSLELDLEKHKADNDQLKQQLKTVVAKRSPARDNKQGINSETPKENSAKRHIFDFSKTRRTPSYSKDDGSAGVLKKAIPIVEEHNCEITKTSFGTTPNTKDIHNEELKTRSGMTNRVGGTSKIKSYRIRTPPSSQTACWEKSTVELDPRSDSSDQNDILSFASAAAPSFSAPASKLNILQKIQSPVSHKSPGNTLKLAAIKRMRDAGWTAVSGCNKKKRKSSEKIFA